MKHHHGKKKEHCSSKSSSESPDHVCKETIKSAKCACKQSTKAVGKLKRLVSLECIPIKTIPSTGLIIATPGCYQFINEIPFVGQGIPAINIITNDVTIDLGGFTLTLDPASIGVVSTGFNNLTIKNGSIVSSAPSFNAQSTSISLTNVDNFTIQQVRTDSTFTGISLTSCSNGKFIECVQENHGIGFAPSGAGSQALVTTGCIGLSFDQCQYKNNIWVNPAYNFAVATAINFNGPDQRDIRISKCSFYNTDIGLGGPLFPEVEGGNSDILIESCVFTLEYPTYTSNLLYMIGRPHGVIVRNCTFTSINSDPVMDAILVYDGSNILIEGCVIESNANGITPVAELGFPSYGVSMIHLGYQLSWGGAVIGDQFVADNVTIRNCTLRGGTNDPTTQRAFHAIYVEPLSNNILIEDINIGHMNSGDQPSVPPVAGATIYSPVLGGAIRVDGATGVVIRNVTLNDVSSGPESGAGPGNGIVLGGAYAFNVYTAPGPPAFTYNVPATTGCTVTNCVVTNCTGDGILNQGISNTLTGNNTFNNTGFGIENTGTGNISNNTATNNIAGNYSAGIPAVVSQGSPAVNGGNLSV